MKMTGLWVFELAIVGSIDGASASGHLSLESTSALW